MQSFQRRLIDVAQEKGSMRDAILTGLLRVDGNGNPLKPTKVQNYSYVGDLAAVAPSASYSQVAIPIQGDSDFIAVYLSGLVVNDATQVQIENPYCKLQITDNSTQQAMSSAPVLFSLLCGNGGFPYIFQEPRLFTANAQINVQFYNLLTTADTTVDMEVSFSGYRVYY